MYLKNIEIQGFKSFANKINLQFNTGITGIVGPNGSGKSNVADAVRWVLGEQSAKQLRGSKMEDVIFAGTESRKALGFASVSITIDNSDKRLPIDYTEVTISRRVYRSGESEYSINGAPTRLKDIQELFFDTGIGKEGYSIIGQGQIDQILNGKPEERRDLFDEAAGIVKFKRRKYTAEKKLDEEKQNRYRINDILSEIENQLAPLKEQSEIAKQYLKLRDELKQYDINIFLMDSDRIKEQLIQLGQKEEIAKKDLEEAKESFQKIKDSYSQLEAEVEEINNKLDNEKGNQTNNQLYHEKLEGDIKVLREQINAINSNDVHIQSRIQAINSEVSEKDTELSKYIEQKQELDSRIDLLDDKQTDEEKKLNELVECINARLKEIEDSKANIIEMLNEIASINNKIQRYDMMLEQISIRKSELHQKYIKNKSDEEEQTEIKNTLESTVIELNNKLDTNSNHQKELELQINEYKTKINNSSIIYQEKIQQYHRLKSKHDALKGVTEHYEGYNHTIRRVMELKSSNKGIIGVVADIISVKKEYEVAVETALGGSIQNIVTDTEATAKGLIEFLKKDKLGRATFLPLTSITNKVSFYNEAVLKENGVIGIASQLVQSEGKFNGLVDYLLGRVVVVRDIDSAIIIAKKYNYSLRIVTLEGESFSPGGSITGGSFKNNNNLLGRRRELEELEQTIHNADNEAKLMQREIEEYKEQESIIQEKFSSIKSTIQELLIEHNSAKINYSQAENKLNEILELREDVNREIIELDNQVVVVGESKQLLADELNNILDNKTNCQERIDEVAATIDSDKLMEKDLSEKVSNVKMELMSLQQEDSYVIENIKRLKREKLKLQEELIAHNKDIEKNSQEIQQKKLLISQMENEIIEKNKELEQTTKYLEELVKEKDSKSKILRDYFNSREEINEKISLLDKEVYRLISQREKFDEQYNNLINYIWDEYEITVSEASALANEELGNLNQMKKRVQDLKTDIKALGDVNVNSITDYKNLLERHSFLETQRNDLIRAEENLLEIIKELDSAMREQFQEKFKEIQIKFDKVFKELFGGGKATLELAEGEDILEAGIKIIAQPPGKKLQNMMQMSGGEKAFTAISLLFAIQSLKPSPFCLLDEIEAALDDANVSRFAGYLQKLTKDTQFIIITHRKGTMEAADALYGITMQEKGISTLVSVKLIESDLDK